MRAVTELSKNGFGMMRTKDAQERSKILETICHKIFLNPKVTFSLFE